MRATSAFTRTIAVTTATCFLSLLRPEQGSDNSLSARYRAGVLDRQSSPVAIGPFLQDLLNPRARGEQGDVGVTISVCRPLIAALGGLKPQPVQPILMHHHQRADATLFDPVDDSQ